MNRLYLHVGMPKTGTSALQAFFMLNKAKLWANGVSYPWTPKIEDEDEIKITSGNGEGLARATFDGKEPKATGVEQRLVQALQTNKDSRDVIISSEFFAAWDLERFLWLNKIATDCGFVVKPIVYLRDQVDMAVAHYFQEAKRNPDFGSRKSTISEFIDFYLRKPYCRFDIFLDSLSTAFGEQNVIVRPFDRSQFPNSDIIFDVLTIVGIDPSRYDSFKTDFVDVNITPQQRDLYFRLSLASMRPNLVYSDALLAAAPELYETDTRDHSANLFVDPDKVEAKRAEFAESNAVVAKRWFGGADLAALLKPKTYGPLKKMETTVEDLQFWLMLTNAALIKSMKDQHRMSVLVHNLSMKLDSIAGTRAVEQPGTSTAGLDARDVQ